MNIQKLELLSVNLEGQRDFYASILELPVTLTSSELLVRAGETEILFTQAALDFSGAYHFAFNIPENQFKNARKWIASRAPLMRDQNGTEEFKSQSWNSDSIYFLDPSGNVLEFIARHTLQNARQDDFNSHQILNVSEIGLPSDDVIGLANELCARLGLFVYKQGPNPNFTPVGDEDGLLILPIRNRIWMPDSGIPARLLPVSVWGTSDGKSWQVRGVPYEILEHR